MPQKPYRRTIGIARFLVRNYLNCLIQEKEFPPDLQILEDEEFKRIYSILVLLIHCRREGRYLKSGELANFLAMHRSHVGPLMKAVKEGLLKEKIILICRRGKLGGYWLANIPNNNLLSEEKRC